MERAAAYGRLAQAMAHEIRNPFMIIGGLVRRIALFELESLSNANISSYYDFGRNNKNGSKRDR